MKKTHLIILIITFMMAAFSAYSLAAINQVYEIDFEWHSQYYNKYMNNVRETSGDRWELSNYPKGMEFVVIRNREDYKFLSKTKKIKSDKSLKDQVNSNDFIRYIMVYCSLGEVDSLEYGIKILDIAQRGNVIEVKVSMNSPSPKDEYINETGTAYSPDDIIRIDKQSFPSKGGLYFIFKNQSGKQLAEKYYDIR